MKKAIYILCFSFLSLQLWSQDIKELQLKHWSDKLGLTSNEITDFAQDYKGFLWVATSEGLNRFDGQSFLNFQLEIEEQNTGIKKLLSHDKHIYVLTNNNELFNISTDSFEKLKIPIESLENEDLKKQFEQLISGHKIEDYNGDHFALTNTGELYRNDSKIDGVFDNFYKDSRHRFWIASVDKGIGYWDSRHKNVSYIVTPTEFSSLFYSRLQSPSQQKIIIAEDKDGRIWFYRDHGAIGFWDYGMETIYTIKNIKSHPYLKQAYNIFSVLIDLEMRSMFSDNSGNLWVGTATNGMFRIRFKQQAFQFYEFNHSEQIGLANEDISSPTPLKNGDVWIGTWGGGVNILKKENLKSSISDFEIITPQRDVKGALQDGQVFPVFEDSKENIWIGSINAGLHFLSKKNREKQRLFFNLYNKEKGAILSDSIMNIFEDRNGVIWISTYGGLTRYIPEKKVFESTFEELKDPDMFKGVYILSVFEDSKGDLWISTNSEGLFKWDRQRNQVDRIEKFKSFSTDSILNIVEESKESLWFSGLHGLFNYDPSSNTFKRKVALEKLPTEYIESMILGADGLLWLGTNKGVFAYNPKSDECTHMSLLTGIRINSFTRGVSKDTDGYLYFGTRNGFYRFHPNKLFVKETTSPVFTDLKIDGVSYRERKSNKLMADDISATSHLHLNYADNRFSISYKNLDFSSEDLTFYETSMTKEDEDDNWTTTYDTSKSWTNLNDGKYKFKVRNNIDSQVSELNIVISPPWWRNVYAFAGYVVIFLLGTYFLIDVLTKRAVSKEKKIQDDKFDKLRFKFFLNIAHEIRTPLTLIKGGVERLKEGNAVISEYDKELNRVYKNTDRLSRLVNEVLDLKKIERTEVRLNLSSVNLKWFLENIIDVFRFRENEANLILKTPEEPIWISSDKQLLESIVYNLISNAIKYSDTNARIEINLFKPTVNEVSIQVKDNGFGIKKEEQQLVFERLYQSDEHLKTGTGIGLAIVKQYVGLLNGSIDLKSDLNKGSTFTVTFPYEEAYAELNTMEAISSNGIDKNKHSSTILIVDDQKELRTFIKEAFESEYNVFEAANGEEGLKSAKKHQPTLIISDVMMPVMNGVEFSKRVRQDISISHTPIILLTAKTGEEAEIEGLASGADAYVNKPFSQKVLKSRVDILIESRKKLIKKYSLSVDENITVLASNDIDKEFLEKFEKVLSKQFSYSDLSVEELASEMAVSVSGFYTKVKSITGSSPVEFVRTYRLKKAAQLLKSTNLSVTEISEETGFGTQKYFSNSFKKHFGVTPLGYRKS